MLSIRNTIFFTEMAALYNSHWAMDVFSLLLFWSFLTTHKQETHSVVRSEETAPGRRESGTQLILL